MSAQLAQPHPLHRCLATTTWSKLCLGARSWRLGLRFLYVCATCTLHCGLAPHLSKVSLHTSFLEGFSYAMWFAVRAVRRPLQCGAADIGLLRTVTRGSLRISGDTGWFLLSPSLRSSTAIAGSWKLSSTEHAQFECLNLNLRI